MGNLKRDVVIISVLFLLVSLIYTYPLCFTFFQKIINAQHDVYGNIWISWWLNYSRDEGLNPQETDYLYYPFGVNLWQTNANFLIPSIVAFFARFFSFPVSFNIVMLLGLFLTALFTYLLVRYLTHNFYAGFISGLIFAFSPYIYWEIWQGSLELIHIEWIPLYCLFLFKLQKEERNFLNIILAIFSLTIACLSNWYYGSSLYLLTLVFLFYFILGGREKVFRSKVLIKIFSVLGITTVILLPSISQLDKSLLKGGGYKSINWQSSELQTLIEGWQRTVNLRASEITLDYMFNIDENIFPLYPLKIAQDWSMILREEKNLDFIDEILFQQGLFMDRETALTLYPLRVFGDSLSLDDLVHSFCLSENPRPHKNIFTYLTIILFIFSLIVRNRRKSLYIFVFLVFTLLSLGPYLLTENLKVIPLPSYLFYRFIPQFSLIGGRPYRFVVIPLLVISLSIGELIAFLSQRIKNFYFLLLGLLLIIEGVFIPLLPAYPFTFLPSRTPPVYKNFLSSENYALIEVPIYKLPFLNSEYIFYQIFHHKPLLNGFHMSYRVNPEYIEFVKNNIFLKDLIEVFNDPGLDFYNQDKKFQYQEAIRELREYNFRYVVFHALRIFYNPLAATYGFYLPPPEDEMLKCIRMFEYLNNSLGPAVKFSDGIAIYELKIDEGTFNKS